MRRRGRWLPALARAGLALALTCALLPLAAARADSSGASGTPVSVTQTATRTDLDNGVTTTVDSRTITLSVSDTTNLRGLQQIDVSWSGAHPTGGLVPDVNDGQKGVNLEYPMVLLECRGVDSASAPAGQQLSPETCWTAYEGFERGAAAGAPGEYFGLFPPWRLDMYASAAQRAASVGVPDPSTVLAGTSPPTSYGALLAQNPGCAPNPVQYSVPFVAASGATYYPGVLCQALPEPPEAQNPNTTNSLTFPSNETYGETGVNGVGSAKFDVFTSNENASLGCSDTVACSLVAIPVMGISCDAAAAGLPPEDQPSPTQTVPGTSQTVAQKAQADCEVAGSVPPGQPTVLTQERSVTGLLWWAPSNWRNRISIPLGFSPVANPCSVTGGSKAEVDIFGSELMTEASAQWDPHFCGDPSLFTLKHVQTGEPQARNLLAQSLGQQSPAGGVSAVYGAYNPTGTFSAPVVSAPVALTGFAIAFAVDDNLGHPIATLRLDARLLAKLLTESYPDDRSFVQPNDPGLGQNPLNITTDPEFVALNPEFGQNTTTTLASFRGGSSFDAAATLYSIASNSDVVYALTAYIERDPEAMAWMGGQPDPWGMVVNPNYKLPNSNLSLPTDAWPLLDRYDSPIGQAVNGCPPLGQTPYLDIVAAPQPTMLSIAQGVEFADPFSTTDCIPVVNNNDPNTPINMPGRVARQAPGQRFILGVVSLGEAARYDLQTASLQSNSPSPAAGQFAPPTERTFVAPTSASLRAAASLLQPDASSGTWQIPVGAIQAPSGNGAYPGTMVVYTQVPTSGLAPSDAANIAKFLRFAATSGQTEGAGYGQLPPGYLPMTPANGMGTLVAYTKAAADAVAAQNGAVPSLVPGLGTPSSSPSSSGPATSPAPHATGSTGASPAPTQSGPGTGPGTGPGGTRPGGTTAIGPPFSRGGVQAPAGAQAPVAAQSGFAGLVGRTLGVVSDVASSLTRFLLYLAALALAAAGVLYLIGRHRGLDVKALIATLRELWGGLVARYRSP